MVLPEKNMCVHWDQMSTSVWLCALSLASLPRLLFHTLYYHTESDWRARLQQRLYFSLNPTSSSVHLCTGYCAFLLCGEQNSIQWREITKHSRHTCFHFRRALMFPGSLVSTSLYSAVYNSKTNVTLHWDVSCEGKGLPVPEDMPVISRDEVHLFIRFEQHPKITDLFVPKVFSW